MPDSPGITPCRSDSSTVRSRSRSKVYYTYSKSLDNVSNEGNGFTDNMDNYNLNLNKGRSDFDRPHVFNAYGTYTLPIGNGHAIGGNMPRWANTCSAVGMPARS